MFSADRSERAGASLLPGAGQNGGGPPGSADSPVWAVSMAAAARRAALDLRRAKEVQARLLPRRLPQLEALSYAGVSLPAGQVGGDYFDFLDLGRGYLGLAVGDVAGKGVAAALLMANLQAHVRGQCALAVDDIGSLLRSVNRLFHESTPPGGYATLFFAEFQDRDRRLRYVNCGHPAALLRHADGAVERLAATATVLGLKEGWDCESAEIQLLPGDTLVLYTDGVTEAASARGEEFGERRLTALMRAARQMAASAWLKLILGAARQFAGGEFQDDATLVAACCAPA